MPVSSPFLRTIGAGAIVAMAWSGAAAALVAGAQTQGGAVMGGRIVHVTTLADDGPGSLRQVLNSPGPKVIVFDVGGVIRLASDIKAATAHTTIAGQTAPPPGVTLTGGSLRLRASDLVVQHIAVRPGPGATAKINGNRDAITIGGGSHKLQNILVENVSLSWSVDEDADIAGGTRNVTVRNAIVAEALNHAGHPKGRHSMGMLINKDNQAVAVTGNLFAADMFRNPVIARGSSAYIGYNLIADPGENAIHVYSAAAPTPLQASIVGNIVEAGPDSDTNITAVWLPDDMAQKLPDARIYVQDNHAGPGALTNTSGFELAGTPPVLPPSGYAPPADTRAFVLAHAGARPAQRDAIDARIVAAVQTGEERIVDRPPDRLDAGAVNRRAQVPSSPFQPSSIAGVLRVQAWLCAEHLVLGGPATPECPLGEAAYRKALDVTLSQRR